MRARTAALLVILVVLGIFTALNWSAFTAPTSLSLGVAHVDAPLGVVLLGVIIALTALYALYLTWVETSALLEARRFARELQTQRQLAESAEASRYAELRAYLETELAALRALPEATSREVIARLGRAEDALRGEIERSGNTLAAYVGELEERLGRGERPA
jgi:hypothetical protein